MTALEEKQLLETAILDYKASLHEIELEIPKQKFQREWSMLRIENIRDNNRSVPSILEESQNHSRMKIDTLKRKKTRLNTLIKQHLERLQALDREVRKTLADASLDWWSISPEVTALMGLKNGWVKEDITEKPGLQPELKKRIREKGLEDWLKLQTGKTGLILQVGLPIVFGSGKVTVGKKYKTFLSKLADILSPYSDRVQVRVEGFADKGKLKNRRFASNWEIAVRRATHVAQELINAGMPPSAFMVISRGKYGEQTDTTSRRVELTASFL